MRAGSWRVSTRDLTVRPTLPPGASFAAPIRLGPVNRGLWLFCMPGPANAASRPFVYKVSLLPAPSVPCPSSREMCSPRLRAPSKAEERARDLARDWAKKVGLDPSEPAQLDFAPWEIGSFGRPAARRRLALLDPKRTEKHQPPAVHLFSAACRLSLRPDSSADEFELALDAYGASEGSDPLWPALARHLVRRSTPEDKALLEDLARHPEKRDPPLSWGLQYIVRGDILLEDGSVVTVDELCEQYKLPRLPYLEDLPPELEIDWEEDKPGKRRTRPRKKAARGTN